jgi:hypothetical protein
MNYFFNFTYPARCLREPRVEDHCSIHLAAAVSMDNAQVTCSFTLNMEAVEFLFGTLVRNYTVVPHS